MAKQPPPDYVPFGPEWRKEMRNFSKEQLIDLIQKWGVDKEYNDKRNRLYFELQFQCANFILNLEHVKIDSLSEAIQGIRKTLSDIEKLEGGRHAPPNKNPT